MRVLRRDGDGRCRRVLLGVALLAAGCGGPGYLVRAGWHEARILLARQPIAEVIARPDVDPALRSRL